MDFCHQPFTTPSTVLGPLTPSVAAAEYLNPIDLPQVKGLPVDAAITPQATEAAVADAVAACISPVVRWDADQNISMVWDGLRWELAPDDQVKAAARRLLSTTTTYDAAGSWTVMPLVQPARALKPEAAAEYIAAVVGEGFAAYDGVDDDGKPKDAWKATWTAGPLEGKAVIPAAHDAAFSDERRINAVAAKLQTNPLVRTRAAVYATNPDTLATASGYICLDDYRAAGDFTHLPPLSTPDPDRCVTRATAAGYDPAVEWQGTEWDRFLQTSLPDPEVRAYLQLAMGYVLRGRPQSQEIFALVGSGSNGKSIFVESVSKVLGELATVLPSSVVQGNMSHPTELMNLRGARLGIISETSAGRGWDVEMVKRLSGGDQVSARFVNHDEVTWTPTHTLVLATNHRPTIPAGEGAFWNRYSEIPFTEIFKKAGEEIRGAHEHEADPELASKLDAEPEVIMAWLVDGLRRLEAAGGRLRKPDAVTAAVREAQAEANPAGVFAAEMIEITDSVEDDVHASFMFAVWRQWCIEHGLVKASPSSPNRVASLAEVMGGADAYERRSKGNSRFIGVKLTEDGRALAARAYDNTLPAGAKKWAADHGVTQGFQGNLAHNGLTAVS